MCYSVSSQESLPDGNPIAPKSTAAFYGAANIENIFKILILFCGNQTIIQLQALFSYSTTRSCNGSSDKSPPGLEASCCSRNRYLWLLL